MALIKQVFTDDSPKCQSVKWVNEHGHDVLVRPNTQFFDIELQESAAKVRLFDPAAEIDPSGNAFCYCVDVVGMTIVNVSSYTPRKDPRLTQGPFDITTVDSFEVLPEHYPMFMVVTEDAGYSMVDYYANELFKTNDEV